MNKQRYVVLDRDGTIIVERVYLSDPAAVELLPGAAAGLRRMASAGLGLVVVTNQSGIGRGFYDMNRYYEVNRRMDELLAAEGVALDGLYCCPHRPEDGCDCRKPLPGMVSRAATELGFNPSASYVIGDKPCDIDLGRAIGAKTFLVCTGYGHQYAADPSVTPDYIVEDIEQAASVIERILTKSSAVC